MGIERKTLRNIVAATGLIVGTIFVARSAPELLNQTGSQGPEGTSDEKTNKVTSKNVEERVSSKTEEEIQSFIANYLFISANFEKIFNEPLSANGEKLGSLDAELVKVIIQKARNHVVEGAYLQELLLPQGEAIKIGENGQTLIVDNTKLDLKTDLHFQIAASLINTKLNIYLLDFRDCDRTSCEKTPAELRKIYSKEIEDLKWLAIANPNITLEPGSFAILPRNFLIQTAGLLRDLQEVGVPFPREIHFKTFETNDTAPAWYSNHKANTPFKITLTNNSDEHGLGHEFGHFVSDAWHMKENKNPNLKAFLEEAFAQMIERIKIENNATGQITDQEDVGQEYAEAFALYYLRGNTFRSSILAEEPGSLMWQVRIQEYNFFKNLFKGKEFRYDGIPVERLNLETKIEIGQLIEITDIDIERPGIFLRPTALLEIDLSFPVVWDEDEVLIIDGPVIVLDQGGRRVEMWKVRVGSSFYGNFYPLRGPVEGWISREWFGRILPP